ncbi:MAG: PilZ domain-containing protein [Spirochaetales bacterium]|nr:PilZ domain-containing protein [Spirochaetales bacterium]
MSEERTKENERKKPRFKIHIQDTEKRVKIKDISSTGCHIETTNKYHLGDLCSLIIKLEDTQETTPLSGKVVWVKLLEKEVLKEEDKYEYGLIFQANQTIDTSKIIDLIIKYIGTSG